MPRNAPRGTIRWIRNAELLFVKWKDTREVGMLSTVHKACGNDTVHKKTKNDRTGVLERVEIPIPPAVKAYNTGMGGLELSDQLVRYYQVFQKTKKLHKTIFLSTSLTWLLWMLSCFTRKCAKDWVDQHSPKDFSKRNWCTNSRVTRLQPPADRPLPTRPADHLPVQKWREKVVFLCTDGASVNMGKKNGVAAKLKSLLDHLMVVHFIAHWLELGVSKSLQDHTRLFTAHWLEMGVSKSLQDNTHLKRLHEMLVFLYEQYHYAFGENWGPVDFCEGQ